jgi:thymidylate synthase
MKSIAGRISEKTQKEVKVGRYADIADSYHIYGSYFDQFKGFLETIKTKTFQQRTYTSEFAEQFFEEARSKIAQEQAGLQK